MGFIGFAALALEILIASGLLAVVARRRGRLRDVLVYGILAAVVIATTGVGAERLWRSNNSPSSWGIYLADPSFVWWGGLGAGIPLATAFVLGSFKNAKLTALAGLLYGAFVALPISQYIPVLGGIYKAGEPWSDARRDIIQEHVLLFGLVGAVVAFIVGFRRSPKHQP